MDNDKTKLYIPINIKTRTEFFEGYGVSEFIKTAAVAVITLLVCLIFHAMGVIGTVALIIILLAATAGSVMFVVKDRNNLSVLDQLILMVKFSKAQKKYPYIYMDEWGDGVC